MSKLTEKVKEETEDLADIGKEIVRKMSTRALGFAAVIVVLFLGVGGLFYVAKDTIVKVIETQSDVKHLQAEHASCHAELAAVKIEMKELRGEVDRLKLKLADNR